MTATPIQPTPDQLALAGPGYDKDALAGFLQEIAEEDQALAAGTLEPPAPVAAPDFATLEVQGDEVEAEQEQGEQRPLAGKFKSPEDLEKAYLELQKKLGQRADSTVKDSLTAEPEPIEVKPLTREESVEAWGESVVTAAEQEGIDLQEWCNDLYAGKDTSERRGKLAAALGLPETLIERYEAGSLAAVAPKEQAAAGLSDEDVASIRAMAGGDAKFAELSQWALANLTEAELADYNDAVNTGNPAAARAAVRWLQSKAATADKEPALVMASGGTANPALDVFETEEEAMEAKQVLTKGGKQRYLVDEKYRRYIDAKFARSPIFL
jgi:hypothetical protein